MQYNFDFDLELIEMSLRIYSCVSLIVPLSDDVDDDVHLPLHLWNDFGVLKSMAKKSKTKQQQAMDFVEFAKIKWYNAWEYFIINDSQC